MPADFHGPAVNYYLDFKVNGKQLVSSNIISLGIREWIFDIVPRLEFILNDDGVLSEIYPLKDGDKINIRLAKHGQDNNPIISDFDLFAWTYGSMMGNKYLQVKGNATLSLNNFFAPVRNRSFRNKTSIQILSQIASESGFQVLRTPSLQTADQMTWIQSWLSNYMMVKHVTKRANIPDDALLAYFGMDRFFHLTSLNELISTRTIRTAKYSIENYSTETFEDPADLQSIWFNTWSVTSLASFFNKTGNYKTEYGYFHPTNGFVNSTYTKDSHSFSNFNLKDPNLNNQISRHTSMGYLIEKNVYPDYFKAMVISDYLKYNFFGGLLIDLNINSLCPVKLGEVINLILPSTLSSGHNNPLSGRYIVAGIVHEANKGDIYKKHLLLFRDGINRSLFT